MGAAITEQMRRDKYSVIGTSRYAEPTSPIDLSNGALQQLDVRDETSVLALKRHLFQNGFNPDVIVLNAGYGISGPIEQTPTAFAQEQFDTNLFGLHRVVHAFLPGMRQRGSGQLIFVGSIARQIPLPFQAFYSASKAALAAYSDALRMEVMAHGISVTIIEPGDHRTAFGAGRTSIEAQIDSPYEPQAGRALQLYEKNEREGSPASRLAEKVALVAKTKNPKPKYLQCTYIERVVLILQAIYAG